MATRTQKKIDTPSIAPDEYNPRQFLPIGSIVEFSRRQAIYDSERQPDQFYLLLDGRVRIMRSVDGSDVVVDIYQKDEFFGEAAFMRASPRFPASESAIAMTDVKAMVWSVGDIRRVIAERPQLGEALMYLFIARSLDYAARIEMLAADSIARRVARTLVWMAHKFGTADGARGQVTCFALSHQLLSQYVGAGREIVSLKMLDFKKRNLVTYDQATVTLNPNTLLRSMKDL